MKNAVLILLSIGLSTWALEPIDLEKREVELEALEAKLDQADEDSEAFEKLELKLETLSSGLDAEAEFAELTEVIEAVETEIEELEAEGLKGEVIEVKRHLARIKESRAMQEKVVSHWRRLAEALPNADLEEIEIGIHRGHFLMQDVSLKRQRADHQHELRVAQRELELLAANKEIAEMRVRQMLKAAEQRAALSKAWQKIGAGWENDEDTEALEEQFEHARQKLDFEESIVGFEVFHAHLKLQLAQTSDPDKKNLLQQILKANQAVGAHQKKIFRMVLQGDDEGADELEEEAESLERAFILAELELELHYAELEGADEAAAEIREEIAEIKSER